MTKTKTPAIQIEQVPVDDLRPDPANPRKISEQELEALTRSVQQFGLVDPIIARRHDGIVVGGHQRLLAARRLGLKTVPVVYVDLSLEQARLLNVALNKISGEWDEELLARMLADLSSAGDLDLGLSGFSEEELERLLRSLDGRERRERTEAFDLDAALQAAQATKSVARGELWALGPHLRAPGAPHARPHPGGAGRRAWDGAMVSGPVRAAGAARGRGQRHARDRGAGGLAVAA